MSVTQISQVKTKILIVDDHAPNIDALAQLIKSDEIEIHSALNAEGALEQLVHHEFALALLDVQMPNVSGFELARLIRGVKRYQNLPIIFVTAHREDHSVIFEGYETGAVDLMFKPLDPHVVRSKVRVFVQLDRQRRELEQLKADAEAANLAKGRFLANMSHEIRTPLAAVLGFSDILLKAEYTSAEKDECGDAIRRNGQLLLKLVDDVLDLSKIEAQGLKLEESVYDLNQLLRDVDSTMSLKAAEKGLSIKFSVEGGIEDCHRIDAVRLKQALLNVIGNAIKFTAQGSVEIQVKVARASDTSDRITFDVKDMGVGLSREQAQRLFQPFAQADSSTKRRFGGTGLGLVISRQIAQTMGGDVVLMESEPGKGSTFRVYVVATRIEKSEREAIEQSKKAQGAREPRFNFAGKKLLIVDDSVDNRIYFQFCLKSTNVDLRLAESGREAVEMAKVERPDAILMDVQMPELDGREATRIIRRDGYEKPIVALTAHAFRDEHEMCIESGCNFVLTKPIGRESLLENLSQILEMN